MKKLTAFFLTLALVLTLLTACGGSASYDQAAKAEAVQSPAAAPMEMTMPNDMTVTGGTGMLAEESGSTGSAALPENRKWIITVHMDAETEALDDLLAGLDERITAMEGYVEDQDIYNGSTYSSRRRRTANLTIRIPAGEVDAFTEAVAGLANVVSTDLSREDITLNYVATESKITALETEEARLLELLAQAETMSDLLEIEARLSDVRYELERYSSQLRLYDNQVDYATIYLFIEEVVEYTPVEEPTVWERISGGFVKSLKELGDSLVDFFVWVIVASPFLVVWGLILTGIVLLVRRLKRRTPRQPKPKNFPFQKNPDHNP